LINQQRRFKSAAAAVDAHGDGAGSVAIAHGGRHEWLQQYQRQIVYDFPAQILQSFQHGGFASAGEAGDEQQTGLQGFIHGTGHRVSNASMILIGADISNAFNRRVERGCPASRISAAASIGKRS